MFYGSEREQYIVPPHSGVWIRVAGFNGFWISFVFWRKSINMSMSSEPPSVLDSWASGQPRFNNRTPFYLSGSCSYFVSWGMALCFTVTKPVSCCRFKKNSSNGHNKKSGLQHWPSLTLHLYNPEVSRPPLTGSTGKIFCPSESGHSSCSQNVDAS